MGAPSAHREARSEPKGDSRRPFGPVPPASRAIAPAAPRHRLDTLAATRLDPMAATRMDPLGATHLDT